MKRTSVRRSAIAGVGVAALITTTLTLQSANAAPTAPDPLTATAAGALATDITADLGADTAAGSYYDAKDRKLVVNVVDDSAAERVRAAGAEPRIVKHSLAALNQARGTLKAKATIPGTSWAMNPKSNTVVVTADRTVRGGKLAKLTKVTDSLGDRVTVKRSTNTLKPLLAGGDAIWGSGSRCSLGFNVTKGGEPYFLTAGHCTNAVSGWSDSQGGQQVAATEGGSFPGDDYGIAKYTADVPHPSEVNLYGGTQAIAKAGEATVGQKVTRSGSTTQVHDGDVTALDATVNYQEGTVEGLIQTTVCAEPGDSGGSLFAGDTALGLTSGGSGNCGSGGETFFQPVTEALQATGTQIG
ncbi:S1 family peptidase [Streptomyces sp. AC536]|uniref:S1 family peptidase n=1 Tax=Streptomyces buecherae TaxID=2763006 RepID=UPI00164E6460|nr:S1 family peptidase [Streptomyces buecherae]MBC3985969.1 S1 family peptidase [Streptomyces buecherae]QNJ43209.1 S1 family peptidase [Streptomyces buecherae]